MVGGVFAILAALQGGQDGGADGQRRRLWRAGDTTAFTLTKVDAAQTHLLASLSTVPRPTPCR